MFSTAGSVLQDPPDLRQGAVRGFPAPHFLPRTWTIMQPAVSHNTPAGMTSASSHDQHGFSGFIQAHFPRLPFAVLTAWLNGTTVGAGAQ